MTPVTPQTPKGTRVRFIKDSACFDPIPKGTTGTVRYVSDVPHATDHGGGYDVAVDLDGVLVGEWTDTSGSDWKHSSQTTHRAWAIRTTDLEVI